MRNFRRPLPWHGFLRRTILDRRRGRAAIYQYPLDPRWCLRVGGDISRGEYRTDDFDRMTGRGHVGPRWPIGRASEAVVLASARQRWLDDEEEFRDLGIRVEGRHRLNRRTATDLDTARHDRRYEGRGPSRQPGDGHLHRHRPGRHPHRASGRCPRLGKAENRAPAGSAIPTAGCESERRSLLLRGFTLGGAFALRWTEYEGHWAPFVLGGGSRSDVTRSLRIDVHNRRFTAGGSSPQVSMVQEERTSNAQLHGDDRISGERRFVRPF